MPSDRISSIPLGRWKVRKWLPAALTVLWVCFIWGNSLQPAEVSGAASGSVTTFFTQWFPWLTDHIIRKTAHFTEYAVLGALLSTVLFSLPGGARRHVPLVLLLGLAVPLADETIQLFVPGRSGMLTDVLLDCSGVLFGLAACSLLLLLVRRSRAKKAAGPRDAS